MATITLPASIYRQHGADPARAVPAEGFGGWQRLEIAIDPRRTALVSMHAWDCGAASADPGWDSCIEYLPRARRILSEVYPPLLAAFRLAGIAVMHVAGVGRDYWSGLPGHTPAPAPPLECLPSDPTSQRLGRLRGELAFPGTANAAGFDRALANLDFAPQARPVGDETVAADEHELYAACAARGINHLIYVGFAIDACLYGARGGMMDMSRRGAVCSTIRQAVTAVETRETARAETAKEIGLWRVAVGYGVVFDLDDVLAALAHLRR